MKVSDFRNLLMIEFVTFLPHFMSLFCKVTRSFTGEMTKVGDSVAVTGVMLNIDGDFGDEEVGYFNMIDATEERVGDDKRV